MISKVKEYGDLIKGKYRHVVRFYGYDSLIQTIHTFKDRQSDSFCSEIQLVFNPSIIGIEHSKLDISIEVVDGKLHIKNKFECFITTTGTYSIEKVVKSGKMYRSTYNRLCTEIDETQDLGDFEKSVLVDELKAYVIDDAY